jgi:hypothetical protein
MAIESKPHTNDPDTDKLEILSLFPPLSEIELRGNKYIVVMPSANNGLILKDKNTEIRFAIGPNSLQEIKILKKAQPQIEATHQKEFVSQKFLEKFFDLLKQIREINKTRNKVQKILADKISIIGELIPTDPQKLLKIIFKVASSAGISLLATIMLLQSAIASYDEYPRNNQKKLTPIVRSAPQNKRLLGVMHADEYQQSQTKSSFNRFSDLPALASYQPILSQSKEKIQQTSEAPHKNSESKKWPVWQTVEAGMNATAVAKLFGKKWKQGRLVTKEGTIIYDAKKIPAGESVCFAPSKKVALQLAKDLQSEKIKTPITQEQFKTAFAENSGSPVIQQYADLYHKKEVRNGKMDTDNLTQNSCSYLAHWFLRTEKNMQHSKLDLKIKSELQKIIYESELSITPEDIMRSIWRGESDGHTLAAFDGGKSVGPIMAQPYWMKTAKKLASSITGKNYGELNLASAKQLQSAKSKQELKRLLQKDSRTDNGIIFDFAGAMIIKMYQKLNFISDSRDRLDFALAAHSFGNIMKYAKSFPTAKNINPNLTATDHIRNLGGNPESVKRKTISMDVYHLARTTESQKKSLTLGDVKKSRGKILKLMTENPKAENLIPIRKAA